MEAMSFCDIWRFQWRLDTLELVNNKKLKSQRNTTIKTAWKGSDNLLTV